MNIKSIYFIFFFSFMAELTFCQTKHALIVAIGNYPEPRKNKWKVINSINDIPLIKNALVANMQFDEKNIRVMADSQATKKGIVDALDELILKVQSGDIVVIHFSSHGEQIEDDDNDEIDGLDETIVPYGAVFSSDHSRAAELNRGYLRDDLFGDKVIQIRNKLGKDGNLLVIIDACHSGTGTRGVQTSEIRGGNVAMVSNDFSTKQITNKVDTAVFKDNAGTKLISGAATYVVISGAQAQENNSECFDDNNDPVGSLSYSFSKAISSVKGNITYRGLFALIENIMLEKAPKQKPVLEGDGVDRNLFGGNYEKQQLYFSINQSQSKADEILVNGGFIAGISKGSVIDFFEPGTSNSIGKKPLNSGKVIGNTAFTSTVKLDKADDKLYKMNPWAFISEISYGAEKLKFFVRDIKPVSKMIRDSLKDMKLIDFNAACDLFLDTLGSIDNWALKYPNSGEIFQDGFYFSGNRSIAILKKAIKKFERFRYLKGLSLSEQDLTAKVDLVFLDENGNIDNDKLTSRTHFGRLELREGDKVNLRIINTGSKQFYINIVDIQPNGIINAVIPNKNLKDRKGNDYPVKWEDCVVKKYDTLLFRIFSIGISKPYGEETFKVFLSTSPIDLEDILTSKDEEEAVKKRGILSGLEKIFVQSNINETGKRGVDIEVNTGDNGSVFSFNFRILPK